MDNQAKIPNSPELKKFPKNSIYFYNEKPSLLQLADPVLQEEIKGKIVFSLIIEDSNTKSEVIKLITQIGIKCISNSGIYAATKEQSVQLQELIDKSFG